MVETNLSPWTAQPISTEYSLDWRQNKLQSNASSFCSTLKNLALPLTSNTVEQPSPGRRLGITRAKSSLTRYKSEDLSCQSPPTIENKNNFTFHTFKLQIKKLESLQCLSLSEKVPPLQQSLLERKSLLRKERISSATARCISQRKKTCNSYGNLTRMNRRNAKEEVILINEKIQNLIKATQNRTNSNLSSKVNNIIKGYVKIHIPLPTHENHCNRNQYVRELFSHRM